jgi:hypothetical protein
MDFLSPVRPTWGPWGKASGGCRPASRSTARPSWFLVSFAHSPEAIHRHSPAGLLGRLREALGSSSRGFSAARWKKRSGAIY